jgi:LysM repeat protein
MLAPISLGLFGVILLIVVVSSLGDGSSSGRQEPASRAAPKPKSTNRQSSGTPSVTGQRVYVVKPGDTLSTIAAKTGIEIDRLLSLNPSIDPQGLVSGQRIKLRE